MEKRVKTRFNVKVVPRAKATSIEGKLGDAYKLRLAAPPVDGRANEVCVRFLAGALEVALSSVRIVRGLTGTQKVIEVDGISPEIVEARLLR
ncbi:MAG: DUF167 domain-containing protein [Bryobacteraceae bacterium]